MSTPTCTRTDGGNSRGSDGEVDPYEVDPGRTSATWRFIQRHDESPDEALFDACEEGRKYYSIILCLVRDFGANVRATRGRGFTPLHIVVANGHHELVSLLVKDLGADVNAKTDDGNTPLHIAAQKGHHGTARLLVKALGADVCAEARGAVTPLHLAARCGHHDVVRALVEFGADVNARTSGWNPLHLAALHGHHDAARVLVKEFGADVDATTDSGRTPLHIATDNRHRETVRVLADELGAYAKNAYVLALICNVGLL